MICSEINAYFAVKFRNENPFPSAQNPQKAILCCVDICVIFGKFEPRFVFKIVKTLRRLILTDIR